MQYKEDVRIPDTQQIKAYYLRILEQRVLANEGMHTLAHGNLLSLVNELNFDERLNQLAKQLIIESICLTLLERRNYTLLTSAFLLFDSYLVNTNTKLNIANAYRSLAQLMSSLEADRCAESLINGDSSSLDHNIFMAFELLTDQGKLAICDYALVIMSLIYQDIASKLSADKYADGSYSALQTFALNCLSSVRDVSSVDYLLSAAACNRGLGKYQQAQDLYRRVLSTNFADRESIRGYIQEINTFIRLQNSQHKGESPSSSQSTVASSRAYPSGVLFAPTMGNSSGNMPQHVYDSQPTYNHQQVYNILFHANILEVNGQYEQARSIYEYLMSVKPCVETQQNMVRCDMLIDARNQQVINPQENDTEIDSFRQGL